MKFFLIHLFLFIGINPMFSQENISWNDSISFDWSYFKAKPPISTMAATTACKISFDLSCNNNVVKYNVQAVMIPKDSWVKLEKASATLLEHEKTHFALTEIYARKIRKAFNTYKYGCNAIEKYAVIAKALMKELNILQIKYDKETNHGIDLQRQVYWTNYAKENLLLYDAYK